MRAHPSRQPKRTPEGEERAGVSQSRRFFRRGSHAVEFALTLPVLVGLASSAVDLGLFMLIQDGMVEAVSNGTRSGITKDQDEGEDPISHAEQIVSDHWENMALPGTLEVTASLTGDEPHQMLQVDARVGFSPYFGFMPLPETVDFSYVMRVLYQPD